MNPDMQHNSAKKYGDNIMCRRFDLNSVNLIKDIIFEISPETLSHQQFEQSRNSSFDQNKCTKQLQCLSDSTYQLNKLLEINIYQNQPQSFSNPSSQMRFQKFSNLTSPIKAVSRGNKENFDHEPIQLYKPKLKLPTLLNNLNILQVNKENCLDTSMINPEEVSYSLSKDFPILKYKKQATIDNQSRLDQQNHQSSTQQQNLSSQNQSNTSKIITESISLRPQIRVSPCIKSDKNFQLCDLICTIHDVMEAANIDGFSFTFQFLKTHNQRDQLSKFKLECESLYELSQEESVQLDFAIESTFAETQYHRFKDNFNLQNLSVFYKKFNCFEQKQHDEHRSILARIHDLIKQMKDLKRLSQLETGSSESTSSSEDEYKFLSYRKKLCRNLDMNIVMYLCGVAEFILKRKAENQNLNQLVCDWLLLPAFEREICICDGLKLKFDLENEFRSTELLNNLNDISLLDFSFKSLQKMKVRTQASDAQNKKRDQEYFSDLLLKRDQMAKRAFRNFEFNLPTLLKLLETKIFQ
eukprot:403366957